jgi:hypothetical protein
MLFFSRRCCDCPQNKIPRIIHLTNQHQINQSFPYRHGSNPKEKKKLNGFLEVFLVFLELHDIPLLCLRQHNFFSKSLVKKKTLYSKS